MRKIFILAMIAGLILSFNGLLQAQTEKDSLNNIDSALEKRLENDGDNPHLLMNTGMFFQQMGAEGDKNAVKKSEKIFKRLIEIEPENAEALCWYGCVMTLKGRDTLLPFNKVKFVNDGLKLMDKAVELDSNNVNIRMIRANTSFSLPEFFNRLETAIEDFEFLSNLKENNKNSLNDETYESVLFRLGVAYQKKGDIDKARESWGKVVLSGKTQWVEKAKTMLNQHEG